MHPQAIVQRNLVAHAKMLEAGEKLAERYNLSEEFKKFSQVWRPDRHLLQDQETRAMFELEALAEFLKALENQIGPKQ